MLVRLWTRDLLFAVGRSRGWCSHYGSQYEGYSETHDPSASAPESKLQAWVTIPFSTRVLLTA